MTIFTGVRTRQTYLDELQASLGLYAKTAAEDALIRSPTSSIERAIELNRAWEPEQSHVPPPAANRIPFPDHQIIQEQEEHPTPSRIISAEDARSRIKEMGVDLTVPDDGIPEEALDILIERKKDERRRQDIFNRAPKGFVAGAVGFGAALAGSMLDPINVAAAFIPVVGPARYAQMLARQSGLLGRTAVRAKVGVVEGAAGAALIEPVVLGSARYEQADYGLTDSLLNIGLGTFLGGGLHVGAGAVGEALSRGQSWRTARARIDEPLPRLLERVDPSVREASLRTAVAQAVSGQRIDVEPILAPVMRGAEAAVASSQPTRPPILGETDPSFQGLGFAQQGIERDWRVANELGVVDDIERMAAEQLTALETVNRLGGRLERIDRNAALNNEANMARGMKQNLVRAVRSKLGIPSLDEKTDFARWLSDYQARGSQQQTASAANAAPPPPPLGRRLRAAYDPEAVAAAAKRSFEPENQRTADFDASRAADETLKDTPDDEAFPETSLEEAVEDATATANALGDPELVTRELAEFDELTVTADSYGNAVRAAANCQIRRAA